MRRGVILLIAGVLLLTGCGGGGGDESPATVSGVSGSAGGYHGVLLDKPFTIPQVTLTDDDDKPYDLAAGTQGKLTLLFFGYIKCPDVCQVVMGTLASAYARLTPEQKKQVQVLYVTTDPQRDTPSALRSYLDRLDPDFHGLTGSIDTIDEAGKPLHVFIKQGDKLPDGGYDVSHSTSVYAVAGDGSVPLVWDAAASPSQVHDDVLRLLKTGKAAA